MTHSILEALDAARRDTAAPAITLTPEQAGDAVAIAAAWNTDRARRRCRRLSVAEVISRVLAIVRADVEAGLGG